MTTAATVGVPTSNIFGIDVGRFRSARKVTGLLGIEAATDWAAVLLAAVKKIVTVAITDPGDSATATSSAPRGMYLARRAAVRLARWLA